MNEAVLVGVVGVGGVAVAVAVVVGAVAGG